MLNVGIGEYIITDNEDEIIITHALGSCVALIIHCKSSKHTAMAHIVLPENSSIRNQALYKMKPGYFASDIVPKMMGYFLEGIKCNRYQLEVSVIGGADSRLLEDVFMVGKKNVAIVSQLLKSYGIKIKHADTGGNISRTVSINSSNGHIHVKRQNMIL